MEFLKKVWSGIQFMGRAVDHILPSVLVDFMKAYPGLCVVIVLAGDYLLFHFGKWTA